MTTEVKPTPTHAYTGERLSIPVEALRPHPNNTRRKITADSVAGLAANIRARGLLSPLLVRELGADEHGQTYQILAGHRRAVALASINTTHAACIVAIADDAEALRIVLAENANRASPDLFQEADAVEELLSKDNWTHANVADALGKPVAWVAQRHHISRIEPSIRKQYEAGKEDWTPGTMELLAHLAPAAQKQFIAEHPWALNDEANMERTISGWLRTLDRAPWDLADAALCPKAGSCLACPKQSANERSLFGVDPDAKLTAKDSRCLDGKCWSTKMAAHVKRITKEHAGEGPLLYVAGPHDSDSESIKSPAVLGIDQDAWNAMRCLSSDQYTVVKATAKGAEPALIVTGKGQGSFVYVEVNAKRKGPKATAKKGDPAQVTLEDRTAKHDARVNARALELLRQHFTDSKDGPPSVNAPIVVSLLSAYGARIMGSGWSAGQRTKLIENMAKNPDEAFASSVSEAWRAMAQEMDRALTPRNMDDVPRLVEEVLALCAFTGIDWPAFVARAAVDVPMPAVLAKALARPAELIDTATPATAPAPERPAKKAKKAKAAKK